MKRTALLINCSRGGAIVEEDLAHALADGTIAGAAVDVFCHEPLTADDPILLSPNLLVSPHSAAQTREAMVNMAVMCVEGCLAVLRGERWPHVADLDVYLHARWTKTEAAV